MNVWLSRVEPPLRAALAQRDIRTSAHCERTGIIAVAIAHEMGMSGDELTIVGAAARLQDLGKIGIPDSILFKPGRLDPAEWVLMKTHSERGAHVVCADRSLPLRTEIARVIHHHHEHYDGNGYPDGLRGDDIQVLSRIISVADSYDAMTEPRVYHPARSHHETLAVLLRERGTKHDPRMVDLVMAHDRGWFDRLVAQP